MIKLPQEESCLGHPNWGIRPSYVVSGTSDSPLPKATLSSVYMWKRSNCRASQSCPCKIIHNLYWIIKFTYIPHPLNYMYPWSFNHSGFCRVNFDLWYELWALHDTRHAKSCPSLASQSIYIRKSNPSCQGYPTCRGETTRPPKLCCPPRQIHNLNVKLMVGWFCKETSKKFNLGQGGSGRGLSWLSETIWMGPCYPDNYYCTTFCCVTSKNTPYDYFLKGKVLTQDLIFNGRILLNDLDMNWFNYF